jgi:hypothetical protein
MNTYQVTIKIYNTYVGDNGFIPHAFVTISGTGMPPITLGYYPQKPTVAGPGTVKNDGISHVVNGDPMPHPYDQSITFDVSGEQVEAALKYASQVANDPGDYRLLGAPDKGNLLWSDGYQCTGFVRSVVQQMGITPNIIPGGMKSYPGQLQLEFGNLPENQNHSNGTEPSAESLNGYVNQIMHGIAKFDPHDPGYIGHDQITQYMMSQVLPKFDNSGTVVGYEKAKVTSSDYIGSVVVYKFDNGATRTITVDDGTPTNVVVRGYKDIYKIPNDIGGYDEFKVGDGIQSISRFNSTIINGKNVRISNLINDTTGIYAGDILSVNASIFSRFDPLTGNLVEKNEILTTMHLDGKTSTTSTNTENKFDGSKTVTETIFDKNHTLILTNVGQTFQDGTIQKNTIFGNGQVEKITLNSSNELVNFVGVINNITIDISYAFDENGDWKISRVNSIDGRSPIDEMTVRIALNNADFDPITGAHGAEAANILYAESANPATKLPDENTNASHWYDDPSAQQIGSTITGIQSLIAAVKSGDSLAMATSSFNIINLWNKGETVGNISTGLNALGDVLSLKNSLERGDTLSALRSGLSISNLALQMYQKELFKDAVGIAQKISAGEFAQWGSHEAALKAYDVAIAEYKGVGEAIQGISDVLPWIAIIIDIKNGEYVDAAVAIVAITYPVVGWVYAAGKILAGFMRDNTPYGKVTLNQSATGPIEVTGYGDNGGREAAFSMMSELLGAVSQALKALPGKSLIAERMPTLEMVQHPNVWTLTYTDQATGKTIHSQFNLQGSLLSEGIGSEAIEAARTDDFYKNIREVFIEAAFKSGAIAPDWVLETTKIQRQHATDPMTGIPSTAALYWAYLVANKSNPGQLPVAKPIGLTTMGWAKKDDNLLTLSKTASTQTVRPIVLDLDGNGIKTTRRSEEHGVLFDVDGDGYAEETDWIDPHDGMLVLDFNGNGSIDGGHELFNDVGIDTAKRGLRVLQEIDANYDNRLTLADPVFAHLQVWRDLNMDGVAQAYELKSMADLGITQLDFSNGSFTQNNSSKTLGQANLTADTVGVITGVADNNLLVMYEDTSVETYGLAVEDQTALVDGKVHHATSADSQLLAGYDRINAIEDASIVVNAAQLLVNDNIRAAGLDHKSLKISAVTNASGGVVSFDAKTDVITFIPNPNSYGDALFTYTVTDGTGRVAQGVVSVKVAAINDLPEMVNVGGALIGSSWRLRYLSRGQKRMCQL